MELIIKISNNKKSLTEAAQIIRVYLEEFRKLSPKNKWGHRMGGACATASVLFGHELKKNGIKFKLLEGREKRTNYDHVWVETETHLIDVTFDQFSLDNPKILIVALGSKSHMDYRKKFNVPKNRKNMEDFWCWHINQRPSSCITKMKKIGILRA